MFWPSSPSKTFKTSKNSAIILTSIHKNIRPKHKRLRIVHTLTDSGSLFDSEKLHSARRVSGGDARADNAASRRTHYLLTLVCTERAFAREIDSFQKDKAAAVGLYARITLHRLLRVCQLFPGARFWRVSVQRE